jgi:hypothetical protein
VTTNPFDWQKPPEPPKPTYPQLAYYHRKMALGIHPRQLRRKAKEQKQCTQTDKT